MKTLKLISMLLIITIVAISCKKETGPAGPAGANGAAGATGTANVIYSQWIGFDIANWSAVVTEYGKTMRIYTDSTNAITQKVVDSAAVLVYFKSAGNSQTAQLPMNFYGLTAFVNQYIGFRVTKNALQIILYNIDDNNDPGTFTGTPSTNAYRYIIIPGGIPLSGAKKTNAELKAMTYQQVCNYLNITE
jgi:hypothetical protein